MSIDRGLGETENSVLERYLADEAATEQLGAELARMLRPGQVIFLQGELGAGKTTLVRGVLRALGHTGKVKSPTYTLIEPYSSPIGTIYHLDLYRLGDPEELDYIGVRDLLDTSAVLLVEWPERSGDYLPAPSVEIHLKHQAPGRICRIKDKRTQTEKP